MAPNEHDNSGFGLFVLSEVGRNFGRFVLGSGKAALRLSASSQPQTDEISFKGTFVGLRLESIPRDFSGVLDEIVSSGEEEIRTQGRTGKASRSSKDF